MQNLTKEKRKTPTKAEFAKRVLTVQSWIIENVPTSVIIDQIIANKWAKSERHAYIIHEKAYKKWLKREDASLEERRVIAIQRLNRRITSMRNEHKNTPAGMRVILSYEIQIMKLEGLIHLKPADISDFDTLLPMQPMPTNTNTDDDEIDYDQLSDEVLMAIAAARKQKND